MIKMAGLTTGRSLHEDDLYKGEELYNNVKNALTELEDSDVVSNAKFHLLKLENEYKIAGRSLAASQVRQMIRTLEVRFNLNDCRVTGFFYQENSSGISRKEEYPWQYSGQGSRCKKINADLFN